MSRINTNVPSMIARHNLAASNQDLASRLERLSTGMRINSGSDDPSGLIVSERLRNDIAGMSQSLDNVERASNVIATAEGALQEASTLLTDIQGLVTEAANTGGFSQDELEANQLQIDSAIESISRISSTTSFAGLNLLNGTLDYITEDVTTSQINNVNVQAVNFGTNDTMPVNVEVLNSAETGQLYLPGNSDGSSGGALASSINIEVQGSKGAEVFSFASGTALSAVTFAVNGVSDATGVSASLLNSASQASGLTLNSTRFGSDAFVSVDVIEDGENFQAYTAPPSAGGTATSRDEGEDVTAVINGNVAVGDGRDVSLRTTSLSLELSLSEAAAQTTGSVYKFDITGGGATFQVGGDVNTNQQVGFGIPSIAAAHLGNSMQGFLSSIRSGGDNALTSGDDAGEQARRADKILQSSINQISNLRGRLGAFERNTLQTTMRSSQISVENLTSAESAIRDADFAKETARLSRAQILQQAGTRTLQLANQNSQSVLSLLGG